MSDRASSLGWMVVYASVVEGMAAFKYFNVPIADRDEAVDAVRRRINPKAKDRVTARRPLSARDLATIRLEFETLGHLAGM